MVAIALGWTMAEVRAATVADIGAMTEALAARSKRR